MENLPQRKELGDTVASIFKTMSNIALASLTRPGNPIEIDMSTGTVKSYDPKTSEAYQHNTPLHLLKIVGIYMKERVLHPRSNFIIDPNTYEVKYERQSQ